MTACDAGRDLGHFQCDLQPLRVGGGQRLQLFKVGVRVPDHHVHPAELARGLVDQMAQLALKVADRGYVLESGKIVHDDSAEALAHDPALEAAYLGKAEAVL